MSTLAYATNAARDAQQALAQAQALQAQQLGQMHSSSRGPPPDPRLGPRVPPLQHQQSNGHAPPPLHHLSSPTGSRDGSLGQERQQQRSPLANGVPPQSRSGEAQSIPSISNMVHGTPSSGPPHTSTPLSASSSQQRSPGGVPQQPSPSSRLAEKASPVKNDEEEAKGANGVPREIPHANITGPGFGGEDLRALRVLDRKFCI
ncbi:hypothetical protein V494_00571 [Pseudogymnoascus sp. VKM F-4513 (FW-928)]|nr:hypothetical protein V494_00571 [Pseudogymnoascus sp. VKM F-4513 (FW-928)]